MHMYMYVHMFVSERATTTEMTNTTIGIQMTTTTTWAAHQQVAVAASVRYSLLAVSLASQQQMKLSV